MEVIKPIENSINTSKYKTSTNYNYNNNSNKISSEIISIDKNLPYNNSAKRYEINENGDVSLLVMNKELEEKINVLQKECEEKGYKIKICQGVRTIEKQNELYKKGRYQNENGDWVAKYESNGKILPDENGNYIVTNAKGSDYSSLHQWGIACDFYIDEYKDEKGNWIKCNTDEERFDDDKKMQSIGQIGENIGLEWGGNWKGNNIDTSHFQIKKITLNDGSKESCSNDGTANLLKNKYQNPANFADKWK